MLNVQRPGRTKRHWPVIVLFALGLFAASPAHAATVVAEHGDASISHDASSDVWSIGSRSIEFTVGFDRSGDLTAQRLVNLSTGHAWDISADADSGITVAGERIVLSSRSSSLTFVSARTESTDAGVLLVFTFDHRARRVRIIRSYAAYPDSPAIETWTRIEAPNATVPIELTNLTGWQLTMPAAKLKWVGCLRSYSTTGELQPFEVIEGEIEPGQSWEIGSDRRSSEQYIPFVIAEAGQESFFGGVMWSGAWRITCQRTDGRMRMTARFPESIVLEPSRSIEVPHTFFGLAAHDTVGASAAVRRFILNGIRRGRELTPLVTYNTWFAYGTSITEDILVSEIDAAASIGVELFVVDAGWYVGAGRESISDFESGLGSLTADADRFPAGLASLADYAHDAGMQFGLWVEPERVALDMLKEIGVSEGWLATRDGEQQSDLVGLVCLAGAPARQWLLTRLTRLIETVRPDYLKWDNNGWINCNRAGHGHGPNEGNFAHVTGLYSLLGQIRSRFPDLMIENVSGGGNRLDFGMLALTDAAWMDDRSYPSSHVRHNLEGLTAAFPPAYLLSFVIAGDGEEIGMSNDLSNIVRSRMPGVLGMTFIASERDTETRLALAAEIQIYKSYRGILGRSSAVLLSGQAPTEGWDVIQQTAEDTLSAIVFAFKSDWNEGRVLVRPRGLQSDVMYEVRSADIGVLGVASGESLMQDGVELVHGEGNRTRAHVLLFIAAP